MIRSRDALSSAVFGVPALVGLAYLGLTGSPFFVSGLITSLGGALILPMVAALLLPRRGQALPSLPVPKPSREALAMIIFIAAWAVLFVGWGLDLLNAHTTPGPERSSWRLALKLVVMVALPSALLIAVGGSVREQWRMRFDAIGFWLPMLVLGAGVISIALIDPQTPPLFALPPRELAYLLPLTFAWAAVEAGLCEEYLFRACLQTRLSAWLRSDTASIALGTLIFGLVHFPGLAWRQPPPGAPGGFSMETLSYCLTAIAPIGILYGMVWARTRNLWLAVAIHALADIALVVAIKPAWFG